MPSGDCFIRQIKGGNTRRFRYDFFWLVEVILVVAAVQRIGHHGGYSTPPASGAARPLLVVGHAGGDVAQTDTQQAPYVDAHFHRGGY